MQMAREGGLWADLVGRAKTRRWGCVLSVHAAGRDCVSHEQPCRSWLPLITPKVAPSYRAAKTRSSQSFSPAYMQTMQFRLLTTGWADFFGSPRIPFSP